MKVHVIVTMMDLKNIVWKIYMHSILVVFISRCSFACFFFFSMYLHFCIDYILPEMILIFSLCFSFRFCFLAMGEAV
jgi:hypothetical protein